ncbi:MAG: hypothetical protein K2L95_04750 [Alphaproteobacteria bacterium]|nr:hypothetical protein [Alphaproteobacteria bacterium]
MPNLNGGFLSPWFVHDAMAYTCGGGYYLGADGTCVICNSTTRDVHYCPGDDLRYPCPRTNTDYNAVSGETLLSVNGEAFWISPLAASSPHSCMGVLYFRSPEGHERLVESPWNGENYYGTRGWYYRAGVGYYLSGYVWRSDRIWYSGVQPCTNAPAHAHYTDAGTPDATDGSFVDANDCPWECNTGYGRTDENTCQPLCTAGMTQLHVGNSIALNIYQTAQTTPALHIGHGAAICHINLAPGRASDTLNLMINGASYHAIN